MLNPNWQIHYDENDWKIWKDIQGHAPFKLARVRKYMHDLLKKYYRTKNGGPFNVNRYLDTDRYADDDRAKYNALTDTMKLLGEAEMHQRENKADEFRKNQDRDENPADAEERKYWEKNIGASLISYRKASLIDERGFWISPEEEIIEIREDESHASWALEHFKSKDFRAVWTKMMDDGWIRIRIELDEDTDKLIADLSLKDLSLLKNVPEEIKMMIYSCEEIRITDKITGDYKVLEKNELTKIASVPNPIRKNEDYGISWLDRVRNFEEKREDDATEKL